METPLKNIAEYKQGVCDVHRLVYEDLVIRNVLFCKGCNSWICDECRPDAVLRAKAMAIKLLNKIK